MKIHSLEGLKQKAQGFSCTVVCDEMGAAQGVRGVTVVVESTPITCLHDRETDLFLWILHGRFVPEDYVRAFLDEGRPPPRPKEISAREALEKFDRYRTDLLPVLATCVQTEGRERYETMVRLNEQWTVLYSGPEGYTRITEMAVHGGGALAPHVLTDKQDNAEAALLALAERFMAECERLDVSREVSP